MRFDCEFCEVEYGDPIALAKHIAENHDVRPSSSRLSEMGNGGEKIGK